MQGERAGSTLLAHHAVLKIISITSFAIRGRGRGLQQVCLTHQLQIYVIGMQQRAYWYRGCGFSAQVGRTRQGVITVSFYDTISQKYDGNSYTKAI
jgi:hypothetical protein